MGRLASLAAVRAAARARARSTRASGGRRARLRERPGAATAGRAGGASPTARCRTPCRARRTPAPRRRRRSGRRRRRRALPRRAGRRASRRSRARVWTTTGFFTSRASRICHRNASRWAFLSRTRGGSRGRSRRCPRRARRPRAGLDRRAHVVRRAARVDGVDPDARDDVGVQVSERDGVGRGLGAAPRSDGDEPLHAGRARPVEHRVEIPDEVDGVEMAMRVDEPGCPRRPPSPMPFVVPPGLGRKGSRATRAPSFFRRTPHRGVRVRTHRRPEPDYFHKVVDCQWACPAHTNVPEYIRLIAQGRYTDAYMLNRESNVFPGILGRTCDRPCEPACRRGRVEEKPVAICRLKRVAADLRDDVDRSPPEARPRRRTASASPASAPGPRRSPSRTTSCRSATRSRSSRSSPCPAA